MAGHAFAPGRSCRDDILDLPRLRQPVLGGVAANGLRGIRRHQGAENFLHLVIVERWVGLDDLVSQPPEHRDRLIEHACMLPIGARARRAAMAEPDAQGTRIGAHLLKERPCRWRCEIGIARRGARGCIENRGMVAHRDRDRVLGDNAAHALAEPRREGVSATRGLHPDKPAA